VLYRRVQVGYGCVAGVREFLFTVLRLRCLCVEIVLGSEYIVTVGFGYLVNLEGMGSLYSAERLPSKLSGTTLTLIALSAL
jgi:hypothetical protein